MELQREAEGNAHAAAPARILHGLLALR